uniref:Serine/threonine-protein kinase haspin n=1 Tax=Labrus bergylta TaxID=56723 RepID=A0A3Q3ERS2_9LABR|nr:serine/threonine-protein kinase haspin [Labrus bergylta]
MKPVKSVFLKTYGKQTRKLSGWLSPEDRKQAFDSSSLSTDGDVSVFEPRNTTRIRERMTSVASHRVMRPAKKKAMLRLYEKSGDEENVLPRSYPQPEQSKTTRAKKTTVSRGRSRPAKRKAPLCLTETSSDEENSLRPSPRRPQPAKQSTAARRSRLVSMPGVTMRPKGKQVQMTSESEELSVSAGTCHKNSQEMSRDSNVHPPSMSRFVTRRRGAVAAKPKGLLVTSSILNSSDDFASGAFGSSRFPHPSRRRRGTRVPPAYLVSSAENSMNAAGAVSFATAPFREISLNESADQSLGTCSRKPMFCSTPSAVPISNRPLPHPSLINDQCSSPPSMSASLVEVMSAFQEELCSPDKPAPSGSSALPIGLHSEAKRHSSLEEKEPSVDLFTEPNNSSCSKESRSHSEDTKHKSAGESLTSLVLLSADDSERSSLFVSASGGLEWLVQALKESCLTECCTVQLQRLDLLTVTQLCSQTTYSSCLEQSGSVHQTNEKPLSVHRVRTTLHGLSETNEKNTDCLHSVKSFESSKHAVSVTDGQSNNDSSPVDCKQSAEPSSSRGSLAEQSASDHHADSSIEFIKGTQFPPPDSPVQTQFTARKDKSLTKECTVQLQKCALSPVIVQQLKECMKQNDAGLTLNLNRSEINPEDLSCSEEMIETMTMQSRNSSSSGAQTLSKDTERDEQSASVTAMLKQECQTDKVFVGIKRLTLSQLKEILKPPESAMDVSDSASDDQAKSDQRSESDANHSNEETSGVKVEKRGSSSSEDKMASDKEEGVPHRRKKASQAPKEKKRRSTSADRPGTTRKACVSGLSVSRWKNKGSTHLFSSSTAQTGGNRAVDCSINELINTRPKPPKELSGTMNFSTPVRENRLDLSSLLADLTPNTHTWSRLKAALSVHRKGMVFVTPRSIRLSLSGSPRRVELADVSKDLFATPFRTPRRLQSHLKSCSSLVVCEEADLSDAEKVFAECGQSRPLPWEECLHPERMKKCVKIGEGTFGEVFSTTNAAGDTVALKIIPLEGSEKVNGEDQKTFGEILHEIIISKELSSLKEKQHNQTHGFIGLNDLHCVQGCYPPDFMNAWDTFNQKKGSENDRPDFFEKEQLFVILEFEFGGSDLENSNGTLSSLGVAKSILHQVTAALAVAEQELRFEHRDLHWGNVLVKTTKQKTGSFLLNGAVHSLETRGVLVRVIDYSLSRLEIDDLTVSCDISNDEELFMGQGDYQFDIYRLMRQDNGNNWSTYHPHTNVLWLHYLCSKLLSMKYRGSGGRGAKDTREELNRFHDNVLQYGSATEALQTCSMFQ